MYLILSAIILLPVTLIFLLNTEKLGLAASVSLILFVPIYGIIGIIAGFLIGITYNFIAKKFGGIEVEIETS